MQRMETQRKKKERYSSERGRMRERQAPEIISMPLFFPSEGFELETIPDAEGNKAETTVYTC